MVQNMVNHRSEVYRYERKFFIQNSERHSVESIIFNHPAFFSEIYHCRYVNNIYFDYHLLNNLLDNIEGNMFRRKYRIRWYGTKMNQINNPVLELKIKKGLVGTKRSYQLVPFKLSNKITSGFIKNVIDQSRIDKRVRFRMIDQIPVLLNRYKRKYFISKDKKFRITIDDDQSFNQMKVLDNSNWHTLKDPHIVIVELKYDIEHDTEAKEITNNLPFRITKSSKYSRGMMLLQG